MPAPVVLPNRQLQLGSFYRDRTGHKYVCYAEQEGTTLFWCLRIHDAKTFLYPSDGKCSLQSEPYYSMDLIEEVRPEAPLFVDPTATIENIDYSAMWDRVQTLPTGIEIIKFSPKTSVSDIALANKDIPSDIRNKLDKHNIGKLWRVRLNKKMRARYEWDIDKAVALVMSNLKITDE